MFPGKFGNDVSGAEGNVGILLEHSPAEGPPVAALLDFCVKQASIWPIPPEGSATELEPLEFITNVGVRIIICPLPDSKGDSGVSGS